MLPLKLISGLLLLYSCGRLVYIQF